MVVSNSVRTIAEQMMETYRVPGTVIAIAQGSNLPAYLVLGSDAAATPLRQDTLFPVASITKLATALTVLRLVNDHALNIDDELRTYLPEAAAAQPGVTLRTLLAHTGGLPYMPPAGLMPYNEALDWDVIARACLQTPLDEPPGTRVVYSNVDYALLAIIVEQLTGQRFPTVLSTLVLQPLNIEGYLGGEMPRPPAIIAGAAKAHAGTPLEEYNSPFWRSLGLPYGGLYTTAGGALALVQAYRGVPAGFLPPDLLLEATSNQTGDLSGQIDIVKYPHCPWGLGPEIHDAKTPHWAPTQASPDSYGHAGATGCIAWTDPPSATTWTILGTRTNSARWNVQGLPAIGASILAAAHEQSGL